MAERTKVRIKSVRHIKGEKLDKNWGYAMQIVTLDNGEEYIDNVVYHHWAKWKPVHWKNYIGMEVRVQLLDSKGHKWIRFQKVA